MRRAAAQAASGRPARRSLALLACATLACTDAKTLAAHGLLEVPITAFDLGEVPLLNERVQDVELRNVGRAPVTLQSVALTQDGVAGAFTVAAAPEGLEPGAAAQIEVRFRPEALAAYRATLRISSDDPVNPTIEVALDGRGFTAAAAQADAGVDFGRVCAGAEGLASLTLRSTGDAALIVLSISFKEGTAPEFSFASSTRPNATVPVGGELTLPLRFAPTDATAERATGAIVLATTDPAHPTLEVPLSAKVNRAPRATIADLPELAPGATATFDGGGSADLDGDLPLRFAWSLRASPIGSRTLPAPLDAPQTSLMLDLPGAYAVSLIVRDAAGCASAPAFKEVRAKPAQELLVELVWDNPLTDLDLHLVPAGEAFFGPKDCYFASGHMQPDWGVPADPSDDPSLDRDALVGFGPEIIGYPSPAPGRYTTMVHFYADHAAKSSASTATLRVYEFGVVKAELKKTLLAQDERWTALTVDWPSGAIAPVDPAP
jgi:hypothetical protein